ncbi:hypothetical protein G1H11_01555 [Phytoactinopolyspora alkaliphila]|uniref:Uncharacterized protein n=1 Tax=Phytoactinopolyspora alkaliphila TaxID=1783498 RepID=A0A6N9YGJ5_9ACTN|nr:hypothetical protein [Phytoactinopolyspora alkaliphila]NED93999.1 hypothetical protein [Phytoactinopolyspora alkaliphila]
MSTVISWCMDCGHDTALDSVPQAMPTEYICRDCTAAYIVEPSPVADSAQLHAVA